MRVEKEDWYRWKRREARLFEEKEYLRGGEGMQKGEEGGRWEEKKEVDDLGAWMETSPCQYANAYNLYL